MIQAHVSGDAVEQGRLQNAAFQLAARDQGGALVEGIVDQPLDALAGAGVHQGTED
ncbi:hypothetical protein D3C75_1292280 [compost metagenome]